ncbi:RNA polymerase subunit sigma-70 [Vibrio paracholerae]|nr:RNA polymerase subunit sigma-70 [Vibrio paracholerae]
MKDIPFLLEAAVVLATFHSPQSHSLSMLMGMNSLAAYLQLQVVGG